MPQGSLHLPLRGVGLTERELHGGAGYNFWLAKLDGFNGDFIRAEMVKALAANASGCRSSSGAGASACCSPARSAVPT